MLGVLTTWRTILLVYRRIDLQLPGRDALQPRLAWSLAKSEIADALRSFTAFPALVAELSGREASAVHDIVVIDDPLSSVTPHRDGTFWPSPDDTRRQLDRLAPRSRYDSVLVFWPQQHSATGEEVPCAGWGLGMGPSDWANGATYAVVGNAPTWAWNIPVLGEVWLHEWLHGVAAFFAGRGWVMPQYDADGGGSHGYDQSATEGWTAFYRDLMRGNVLEGGRLTGIPADAWRTATPRMEIALP